MESSIKHPPSLVQYCLRVLSANTDVIAGFGDDMPYRLVKPVLQGCSPDTLARLEQNTPHIMESNEELWRDHCLRDYPVIAAQYSRGEYEEPLSWRDEFIRLRQVEAKRLEEAGNKIRSQRLEAEELKRKRQVQLTDRLLPQKRFRGGWTNGPAPPKTLFQKTRAEATKIQKSVFGSRLAAPMHATKTSRIQLGPSNAQLTPSRSGTPITVRTVRQRMPSTSKPALSIKLEKPKVVEMSKAEQIDQPPLSAPPPSHCNPITDSVTTPTTPNAPKLPRTQAKGSMSCLFMPKHRAYSQLPKRASESHKVPAR